MSTPAAPGGADVNAGVRPAFIVGAATAAVGAGLFAAWQPLVGFVVGLLALTVALIRHIPLRRMAPPLVVVTAVAAIGGPNLAPPGFGEVFLFRVLIILFALGLSAYLLLDGRVRLPAGSTRPAALLGLWFVWMAVSMSWAENIAAAVRWTSFMAMMGLMAVAIAVYCADRRRAKIMLWALLATFVVAGGVAVMEVGAGVHLPTFRAGSEARNLIGVGSLFGNQNNFATFLGLSLPYLAALPLLYRDVRLRAIGIAGAIACVAFILLAGSKSGLLSAGFVLIGLVALAAGDRRTRRRLFAALGVAALAAAIVIPALQGGGLVKLDERTVQKLSFTTLSTQIETGSGSGAVRATLLRDGLHLLDTTNGVGVGAGNAETRVEQLGAIQVEVPNLHNWWLEVLVNGGLIGFALYVAFYATLIRRQMVAGRTANDPLVRYMTLAGAVALIGWIAGSIGPSTAIHFAPMWIVFGLSMGALALAQRERTPSAS